MMGVLNFLFVICVTINFADTLPTNSNGNCNKGTGICGNKKPDFCCKMDLMTRPLENLTKTILKLASSKIDAIRIKMGTDKYTRSATGCYGLEMTGHLPVYNDHDENLNIFSGWFKAIQGNVTDLRIKAELEKYWDLIERTRDKTYCCEKSVTDLNKEKDSNGSPQFTLKMSKKNNCLNLSEECSQLGLLWLIKGKIACMMKNCLSSFGTKQCSQCHAKYKRLLLTRPREEYFQNQVLFT